MEVILLTFDRRFNKMHEYHTSTDFKLEHVSQMLKKKSVRHNIFDAATMFDYLDDAEDNLDKDEVKQDSARLTSSSAAFFAEKLETDYTKNRINASLPENQRKF